MKLGRKHSFRELTNIDYNDSRGTRLKRCVNWTFAGVILLMISSSYFFYDKLAEDQTEKTGEKMTITSEHQICLPTSLFSIGGGPGDRPVPDPSPHPNPPGQ